MVARKMMTEQWSEFKKDLQDIFDNYMIRWEKRLNEMCRTNHHVIIGKQEPKKMIESGAELSKDDSKLVIKEADIEEAEAEANIEEVEVEADIKEAEAKAEEEIQAGVQASMDTKMEVVVVKDQAQPKEPTKFEDGGKWPAQKVILTQILWNNKPLSTIVMR